MSRLQQLAVGRGQAIQPGIQIADIAEVCMEAIGPCGVAFDDAGITLAQHLFEQG